MASGIPRGRGDGRRRYAPLSEINVTPLVDVMLVLLIVFMVTAPLLTVGVPLDLPKTQAARLGGDDEPLVVSIDARGRIFLQNTELSPGAMTERLRAIVAANKDVRVFVRGDKALSYGAVMDVMGKISSAGISKVSLMANMPE